jgi:hypothetical protein
MTLAESVKQIVIQLNAKKSDSKIDKISACDSVSDDLGISELV